MIELGTKDQLSGKDKLRDLKPYADYQVDRNRPVSFPRLREGEKVIVGYDQGLGERMFVCDTLEEMQKLYDLYARGSALHIHFYASPDPGVVTAIPGNS